MRNWCVFVLLLLAGVIRAATAPTILAIAPADGSTGIDCFSTITITFSEAMDPPTTQGAIAVTPNAGSPIGGSWIWISSSQVSFRPSAALSDLTAYTVSVATSAVSLGDVPLAASGSATFTTTTLLASGTPLPAGPVMSVIHLGAATDHISGNSQALIWDRILNSGYGPEQLLQPTPGVTMQITFQSTLSLTWQVLTSTTGIWDSDSDNSCVDYFGVYVIAPSSRSAQIAATTSGAYDCWIDGATEVANAASGASSTFTLPIGLHLLLFKTIGGSGAGGISVALTDTSGTPFADLHQISMNGLPPQVSQSFPATGAIGWTSADDLLVQFTEPMNTSAASSAASVSAGSGGSPSGTWSWPTPELLCFRPSAPLASATTYTITLNPGGCEDLAGNTLTGATTISFTTRTGSAPVPTGLTPDSAQAGSPVSCSLAATSLGTHLVYPVGAVPFQGHRYVYSLVYLDFDAAEAACEATGGHLATLSSQAEDTFVWQLGGYTDNWIGLTDIADGQTWLWITGEPMPFIDWAPNQPIDNYYGTIQNYGHFFWSSQWDGDADGPRTFVEESDVPYGPQVELVATGLPTITTTATSVTASGAACTFDLTGAFPGIYDCRILNPDGTSATLPAAFTVGREAGPTVAANPTDTSVLVHWSGSSTASSWLVVRRPASSSPTQPTDGATLTLNAALGAGTVVAIPTVTWFTDTGVQPSTGYAYDVYGYAANDVYTAPGTVTTATSALVQPTLTSVAPTAVQPQAGVQLQLTGTGFDGGAQPPPPGSVVVGTHAYQTIATSQTWAQAQAQAIQLGGTLPIITSQSINNEVLQASNGVSSWIGSDDPTSTGHFVNADGSPLTYTNWSPGEPNNIGSETVDEMYGNNGLWNNLPPGNTMPSVIEYQLGALPSVLLTKSGQPSITAILVSCTTTSLSIGADLTGAAHGSWTIVLTNPDGGTVSLPNALFVDQPPVAGPPGCLTLHGTMDTAESQSTTSLDVTGPCTLECWFRSRAPVGPNLFTAIMENSNPILGLGITSSTLFDPASNWEPVTSPGPAIGDGAWHHAAIVSTGSQMLLYQDAVLAATAKQTVPSYQSATQFLLGDIQSEGSPACDLAEVRFWSAALPPAVIADWRGALASPAHPYWSSLVTEYQLNQTTGTSAIDDIGGLDAAFAGAPSWSPGMVFVTGTEETTLTGTLTGSDPDADPITFTMGAAPSHGSVTIDSVSGAYTYIPAADWYGTDAFTYTVSDGTFSSPPTQVTVYLTRTYGHPALAEPGLLTVFPGVAQIGTLNSANSDDLPLTFSVVTPPTQGTATIIDASLGVVLYTPDAGAIGTDSFTFTVSSGTATSPPALETISIAQAGYPIAAIDLGPSVTNASSIAGTIIFSEAVNGLTSASLAVANGQISNLVGTNGTPSSTYSFELIPSSAGLVSVMLPEGAVADLHGIPNLATVSSVLVDWTVPQVTLIPATTSPVAGVPMSVTAEFSEPTTALSIGGVGFVNATVTGVTDDGQLAQIDITPVAAGSMTITIPAGVVTDLAGNGNSAASFTLTVAPAPTVGTGGTAGTSTSTSTSTGTGTGTSTSTGSDTGTGTGTSTSTSTDTGSGTSTGTGTGTSTDANNASSTTGTSSMGSASTGSSGKCGLGGGLSIILLGFLKTFRRRSRGGPHHLQGK